MCDGELGCLGELWKKLVYSLMVNYYLKKISKYIHLVNKKRQAPVQETMAAFWKCLVTFLRIFLNITRKMVTRVTNYNEIII